MDLKNYLMRRISRLDKKLSITKDAIVYKDPRDTYISESCTLVKLPDIIQKVHYLLDGENIIITSELEEGIPDEYFIVSNEFRKEDFKTIRCLEKTIVTPMHPLYKFVMKAALEAALFEAEDRRACTQEIDADELLAEHEEMNATRQHDFEEAAMELESTKIEVLKQKEWIVNKLKQASYTEARLLNIQYAEVLEEIDRLEKSINECQSEIAGIEGDDFDIDQAEKLLEDNWVIAEEDVDDAEDNLQKFCDENRDVASEISESLQMETAVYIRHLKHSMEY